MIPIDKKHFYFLCSFHNDELFINFGILFGIAQKSKTSHGMTK